ncbi:MAG: hypothetical protein ABR505_11215 [Actinomycetota bacterium]
MKKLVVLVALAGLLLASLAAPADAQKKKKKKPQRTEREVSSEYQAPAIGSADAGGACLAATNSCGTFTATAEEHYMKVVIEDAAGGPVSASVGWDVDGDGLSDTQFTLCGETASFMPIDNTFEINVFIWALPSSSCPDGHATTGTVTATFSNLP